MSIADLPDGRIYYQLRGDGPTLVLLTPQSTGPAGRDELIDVLSGHYSVVTYHQRGTGKSSPAPGDVSMSAMAKEVIELTEALDVDKFSIVCHSTGCGIGLTLAANYADSVDAIVLAAPWSYGDSHLTAMQNLRIAVAKVLEPVQYARFNSALLFSPEFRRANKAGFDDIANNAFANPHDAAEIARRLNAILEFDARPLLSDITHRTLITASKDDQLMPSWFAKEIANGIVDSKYIEFEEGGHMFPETLSGEFAKIILSFLQDGVTSQGVRF